jgi:hypothetical protein
LGKFKEKRKHDEIEEKRERDKRGTDKLFRLPHGYPPEFSCVPPQRLAVL